MPSGVIDFIWHWGPDLTAGTKLSEPVAQVLMHLVNFSIFFAVLAAPCVAWSLARRRSLPER